jgi:hypothetical protein
MSLIFEILLDGAVPLIELVGIGAERVLRGAPSSGPLAITAGCNVGISERRARDR